jgi:MerR family redox-sensitive transcriptional activator SoxR
MDLTIGELARRSGVATSALRFYESRGLISSQRTAGNQRRYERAMLRRVAFIRIAQQVGISLDEIQRALDGLPGGHVPTKRDWERLSRGWRDQLDQRIETLTRLRDELTGCIGCGCISLGRCRLDNPADALGADGSGPRRILG